MKRKKLLAVFFLSLFLFSRIVIAKTMLFDPDDENNEENFVNGCGWNREAIDAGEWKDSLWGIEMKRYSDHEISFFKDLLQQNEDLAIEYSFIASHSGALSGSASSMVQLALKEWEDGNVEAPPTSDNIKYNWWYYGDKHHITIDTNGDGRTDYDDFFYYPWCCAFISWLADQCGLIDYECEANGTFRKTAGCGQMQNFFRNIKGYEYWECKDSIEYGGKKEPVPGDIIIWPGHEHIGIIVGLTEDGLDVVEGNIHSRVSRFIYTRWDVTAGGELAGGHIYRVLYPSGLDALKIHLRKEGFNEAVIMGITSSLEMVSGCQSDKKLTDSEGQTIAFGIAQWQGKRLQNLIDYAEAEHLDVKALETQLSFLLFEMEKEVPVLFQAIETLPEEENTAYTIAYDMMISYLYPGTNDTVTAVSAAQNASSMYRQLKGLS